MKLTITELYLIHDCLIRDMGRIEKELDQFTTKPWQEQDYEFWAKLILRRRDLRIAAHKIFIEIERRNSERPITEEERPA